MKEFVRWHKLICWLFGHEKRDLDLYKFGLSQVAYCKRCGKSWKAGE